MPRAVEIPVFSLITEVAAVVCEHTDAAGEAQLEATTEVLGELVGAVKRTTDTTEDVWRDAEALDRQAEDQITVDRVDGAVAIPPVGATADTEILGEEVTEANTTTGTGIVVVTAFAVTFAVCVDAEDVEEGLASVEAVLWLERDWVFGRCLRRVIIRGVSCLGGGRSNAEGKNR